MCLIGLFMVVLSSCIVHENTVEEADSGQGGQAQFWCCQTKHAGEWTIGEARLAGMSDLDGGIVKERAPGCVGKEGIPYQYWGVGPQPADDCKMCEGTESNFVQCTGSL